jgi:hypothetical protein
MAHLNGIAVRLERVSDSDRASAEAGAHSAAPA